MSELLSIVVPVYNEEATVGAVIERLLGDRACRSRARSSSSTTDRPTARARVLDALPPRGDVLRIVHAAVNGGKGRAIRTGFEQARGTIVAIQDADLELDPAETGDAGRSRSSRGETAGRVRLALPPRLRPARRGSRVAANRFLTGLTNVLYGSRLTDMETCYKVMRTEVARALELEANRFDIEPEITAKLLRAGHRIVERPVRFEPRSRAQGKKIGWRDGVQAIAVLLKHRWPLMADRGAARPCARSPAAVGGRSWRCAVALSASSAARGRPADPIRRATR